MAREKESYRDNLERLDKVFPDKEMLSPADVAQYMGVALATARSVVEYTKAGRLLLISKAKFARFLS